jgi:hypothetical protein
MHTSNLAWSWLVSGLVIAVMACGPGPRHSPDDGGGGDGAVDAPMQCVPTGVENTPALCSDGIDNDCSGHTDCHDPSCSGIGQCPVCGTVEHPTGMAIDLPDGVGGTSCTNDASCPTGQHCFTIPQTGGGNVKECRESYRSAVHFMGFSQGQTLMAVSDIQSVCVTMSHEWIRDLQIDLIAPSGQKIALDKFLGQDCPSGPCEVFLGHPLDTDGDCPLCHPEEGRKYCWTPTATKPPILDYANQNGMMNKWHTIDVMPPGDYQAAENFANLIGATLNGDWTISVTDLWPIDAGKIHNWTISFNPAIVQDCDPPIQ